MVVEKGSVVKVHYTGTLDSGEEFDSSEGKEPITFEVGSGQIIPGFEKAVIGMKEGEEKDVHIKAEDAYGNPNPELVQKVPKNLVPENIELKEGVVLGMQAPTGQVLPAKVVKIEDDTVELDLNHPLAGKDLNFKIKVVEIVNE